MTVYSAGEAIGPAWERTKSILFHDRRWPRIFKICFVALASQLGGFNGNFNSRGGNAQLPAALRSMLAALGAFFALISVAIGLGLLYVGARLQFVLFDIVLLRDDRVAPAWRRHGSHTWRWLGIKVVFGLCLALLLSPLLIPAIVGFVHLFQSGAFRGTGQHVGLAVFRIAFLFIAEAVVVGILFLVLFRVFTTLALPGVALEDLSFANTYQRVWLLVRADPRGVLVYALLMPVLIFGLSLVLMVSWFVALAVPAIPIGLAGWALWAALHGTTSGMFALGTMGALAAVALAIWALVIYLVTAGTLVTFYQSWGMYFVGGRYPLLGQYLEPAPLEPAPQLGFRE